MLVAGVDEAGRGPALGPMALALVVATKEQEELLLGMGVRDSKELQPKERERLEKKILDCIEEYRIVLVEPKELDALMERKSLNEIEAMRIAEMLNSLNSCPEIVFVDSPDIIERNFAKRIKKYCSKSVLIRAEHFADKNYAVVSAASILAKTARDRAIEMLKREFGEIGSGYSSDPITIEFLQKWVKEKGSLPPIARKNWETSKRELDKKFQTRLS
ncbi:MAG: ribonuclease HII [Candidatus Diapherotrites archaeon]